VSSPLDDSCLVLVYSFPVTLGRGALGIGVFHLPFCFFPGSNEDGGWQMLSNFANCGSFLMHLSCVIWVR
jgi:hypothetical protein